MENRINEKFSGKVLLFLGGNVGVTDMIAYAKRNGAYTIVTDYYPIERSEAKQKADLALSVSTNDIEALVNIVKEYHVDGVLAGISEFNLLKAMELCETCGLPFYCTKDQWDIIEDKEQFRKLCVQHKVPCPKTFYTGEVIPNSLWESIEYPVVLKPVDASASSGVYICNNEEELRVHEVEALNYSTKGRIIIEQFFKGEEFTAHYTICDGKVTLSCVDNRYPVSVHEGKVTTIPIARIYPCLFLDEFLQQVDKPLKSLFASIGVQDAIVFIQGLYNAENNSFSIFEAGLRSAGEAPFRFIEKVNGINPMHVVVDHALLGKAEHEEINEDPAMQGKCCGVVSFVAKGGRVGKIIGLEEAISNCPSVIAYESRYPVGAETPNGDTLRQLMIRFVMICDNREQMAKDVAYLNEHIEVLNDKGEDMVIKLQPERIYRVL